MHTAFKRPLPLREEENDLKERVPPRQHSPVRPEWKQERSGSSQRNSDFKTNKKNMPSRTFIDHENFSKSSTQKIYDEAFELKKEFEKSLKRLEKHKKIKNFDSEKQMERILNEIQKINLNFDLLFREIYSQQREILSIIENF
jgi:hypothetical protein